MKQKVTPLSAALVFVVFIITGLVFYFQGNTDKKIMNETPVSLEEINILNCEKNTHVKGEIYACLGPYAEEYQTRYFVKTSDSTYYYFIPVGTENFISISTSDSSLVAKLNALDTATTKYINGEADNIYYSPIEFEGKIIGLDSEMAGYLYDWLYSTGFEAATTTKEELKTRYLGNYKIVALSDGGSSSMIVGGGMTIIGLIGLLVCLLIYFTTRNKAAANAGEWQSTMPAQEYQPPIHTNPSTPTDNYSNVENNNLPQMESIYYRPEDIDPNEHNPML